MTRLLLTLGAALLVFVGLAAAASVLAYGTEPTRDGTLEVDGLEAPVTIAWGDSGRVWIEGADDVAVAAGLGYAHAVDMGWAASLWRQAAQGTLSAWFGEDVRELDLHARTLGFGSLARRTYETLTEDERRVLEAYARGASAGFAEPGVAQGNEFIVADVVPGAWSPWDALAVERLHVYLAAPALSQDTTWTSAALEDSVVARFVIADSLFRAFFKAEGGGFDRAYASSDSLDRGGLLAYQASAGSSALPLLSPAVLRTGGQASTVLTIPGTLASPTGWSGGRSWALLRGSALSLERYGGPLPSPVFSRIVERDGDETLLEVARDTSGLVLRAGTAATDSVGTTAVDSTMALTGWRVRWSGFGLGTDLEAYRALRAGRVPTSFTLLDGDGLTTSTGSRVLGSPAVALERDGTVLVASDSLARYGLTSSRAIPDSVIAVPDSTSRAAPTTTYVLTDVPARDRDVASEWARGQLPGLIRGLGARDSLPDVLQTSYAYLNGWDGAYRADAIAPSIFEWWLRSHRELTGAPPDLSDSLSVALLPSSLRIARAELRDRYGPLTTTWRWGVLQGGPDYPLLSTFQMAAARSFARPLAPPGGHPTSLQPGPSVLFEKHQPGRAVWSVRIRSSDGVTTILTPLLRPDPTVGVDLDAGPSGPLLVIDPSAPLPESRLDLTPRS
ncbi:penicillin acylase family protein [Rubrivirga sp.]|uniref:penicillin acylase family protein n=1 Tax=Rubrivirga sp. TaxID=1885344 RepID=UPI003C71D162